MKRYECDYSFYVDSPQSASSNTGYGYLWDSSSFNFKNYNFPLFMDCFSWYHNILQDKFVENLIVKVKYTWKNEYKKLPHEMRFLQEKR